MLYRWYLVHVMKEILRSAVIESLDVSNTEDGRITLDRMDTCDGNPAFVSNKQIINF